MTVTSSDHLHRGLYETHIPVTDLERSTAFYRKLGFAPGFGSTGDGGILLLHERGGVRWMLGLFRVEEIEHRHPAEYHLALRVPGTEADRMIPYLRERGIEPIHPPTAPLRGTMEEPVVHGWMPAASVFFRDPDGHLLELVAELDGEPRPDVAYEPLSAWRER